MRRKIEDEMEVGVGNISSFDDRWEVLQQNLTKTIEANELKRETVWVKEGECAECGAFDVLSRVNDRFICPECTKLLNSNGKNNKSKRKKTAKTSENSKSKKN